tara:strand:+ start:120 stop:449 length:330 start_codon:yes stop_codon:yes gene_type:complete
MEYQINLRGLNKTRRNKILSLKGVATVNTQGEQNMPDGVVREFTGKSVDVLVRFERPLGGNSRVINGELLVDPSGMNLPYDVTLDSSVYTVAYQDPERIDAFYLRFDLR